MEVLQFTWITYLEQLTCQSKRQRSQLHRIQETTENFRLPSGLQRISKSPNLFIKHVAAIRLDRDFFDNYAL